jgi:hypothetical protein
VLAGEVLVREVLVREVLVREVLAGEVLVREVLAGEVLVREVLVREVLVREVLVREVLVRHSAGAGRRCSALKLEAEFGRCLARRTPGPVHREVVQCCQRPGLDPVEVQDSSQVVDLVLGDSGWPAREYGRVGGTMLVQGIHPH